MKKTITLFLAFVASVESMLASVTIDGIAYYLNKTDLTAEVAWGGKYSGSIVIPDSVVYIGEFAFLCCFSLESDILLQGIHQVTRCCFDGCSRIKKVEIGKGIKSIESSAFAGCSLLDEVVITEGTKYIGTWAFADCPNLASVSLPKSIERIEPTAFDRCNRIERVVIPQGTTDYFMRFEALKQYRHRFVEL